MGSGCTGVGLSGVPMPIGRDTIDEKSLGASAAIGDVAERFATSLIVANLCARVVWNVDIDPPWSPTGDAAGAEARVAVAAGAAVGKGVLGEDQHRLG